MAPATRITVEEDYEEAGGHAILTVPHDGPPPPDLRLGIRRFGFDDDHLGPRGWQGPECLLSPLAVEAGNGALVVRLGPAIVDHIDPHTPVEIAIPALDTRATVHWPEIAPATDSGASGMRVGVALRNPPPSPPARPAPPAPPTARPQDPDDTVTIPRPAQPAQPPPPETPATAPPVPLPSIPLAPITPQTAAGSGPATPPASAVIAPAVTAPIPAEPVTTAPPPPNTAAGVPGETAGGRTGPPPDEVPPDDGRTKPPGPRWPILAAAAALAAVVVVAVLYALGTIGGDGETSGPTTAEAPAPAPSPAPAPAPAPAPPAPGPTAAATPPPPTPMLSPIERAKEVMARTTDAKAIYDEAMTMLRSGDADTAFLLFEQAELRDYGPASTAIGAMRDPSRFDRRASAFDKPNPRRALDDYRRARDRGDPAAEEAIAKLRQWLETAASRGDAEARRILEGGV